MRASGILLHISSLPSPYGIGTLGAAAREFLDFLVRAGQSYWQVLPMNPTGYGDSPYQALSTFAGNDYLLDLDALIAEGLLTRAEVGAYDWGDDARQVDFGRMYRQRHAVLRRAYARFVPTEEYHAFLAREREWLPDYALYMALKGRYAGQPWPQWPEPLRLRQPEALASARTELAGDIGFHQFLQYLFDRQWTALRADCARAGVQLIGDVPIYVPLDSADAWAAPELFWLAADGTPVAVAGCPPDQFNADGQLWGNPLYRWDAMRADGYGWWLRRLRACAKRYDVIRLDHFRGFESYWAVPYGAPNARGGQWLPGPGEEFVRAVREALPGLRFIAEDLGFLTPEVIALQRRSGFPGMKVLEFAFDPREPSDYLPHNYTPHSVCYTGTHDNPPLCQWIAELDGETRRYTADYLGLDDPDDEALRWALLRAGFASVSGLFLAQMQDYLDPADAARMNEPGYLLPTNWRWRLAPGAIPPGLAERLADWTRRYGRVPTQPAVELEHGVSKNSF